MRLLELSYECLVIFLGILIYGTALIPAYALIRMGQALGFPWVVFFYPAAFYLFVFCLILLTGVIKKLCVPKLKPGTYKFATDKHVYTWFISRSITEFVLTPFNRIIFTNDIFRYVCLRLFGVKLHYSSGISSSFLSDLDLLSFGKNCMVGGWAIIYGHVEPEPGSLILAPITIGDNTMIGARTNVGCGTRVGNDTVLGFSTITGVNCKIGDRCNVGIGTGMGHHVLLEDDAKVGKYCSLGTGVKIRKGIKVPDYSMIPDFTTLATQELADSFRTARLSEINQAPMPQTHAAPMVQKRPQVIIRPGSMSSRRK